MPTSLEQLRALLEEAMGYHGEHWVEEAVRRLEAHRNWSLRQRIYDVTTVGARIRTAREVVGWTQPQLAARVGVHPWAVSNWETGRKDLLAKMLPAIATCLGVSRAWLLMESDEGGPPVPSHVLRKQFRPNWAHASNQEKAKARARAELERLRGLRPPKAPREG